MKPWMTATLAAAAVLTLIAAVGAVQGTHSASGNTGYLGTNLAGVLGEGGTGVRGNGTTIGVSGQGITGGSFGGSGTGVHGGSGSAAGNTGVRGNAFWGVHGIGAGNFPIGVVGQASYTQIPGGIGIYGYAEPGSWAGYFEGDVHVEGTLSKSAGSFRIDHPLDPANMYLSHSFVESPDMKNVYDGVVVLDGHGEAVVELPAWFDALNDEFRYQLTCIGWHAPVYVAEEITSNTFRIAGGYGGMKVSWQVTGTRKDPYAVARRIAVEEMKPLDQRGRYLHPELYGQPRESAINAQRRQLMKDAARPVPNAHARAN